MKKIWICVYRDTIEQHDEDDNLAEVLVTREFAEQYFKECNKGKYFKDLEDFLAEYIADDTDDFYEYAIKHNAVIEVHKYITI